MLDINVIRNNPDLVKRSVEMRNMATKVNVDHVIKLDADYRQLLKEVEDLRSLKNTVSKKIGELNIKQASAEKEELLSSAASVKASLAQKEPLLTELEQTLNQEVLKLPNLISSDVPFGKDDSENVILRTFGQPTKFDFEPKDHVALGEALDIIDIETSAKVSGSRFNYLKGDAVLLQFALINFVFETFTNSDLIKQIGQPLGVINFKPFTPILPPVIMKAAVMKKMDRLDPIDDRYYLPQDEQVFVGSAEHTMGSMYMDSVLKSADLPIRYIGYSTAFRREAGSYGKDVNGILRRHQFDKLEAEIFSMPEFGQSEQNLIVGLQEYMLQQLQIPYEVMQICTGDMGKPDYKQIDINCYMPGQGKYRETHTSDYMTDYQARRLNTKYVNEVGETGFVHMNDATAFALGRILIAIIENYQQKDGSIKVPQVLQKYMFGKTTISKG